MPVAGLVPYANNAKMHSDAQVDTIVASMEEFGNCDPIAVWHNAEGEMEIVEGHGRVLALKKLGMEMAPVIYLDHLTDEQRRAYTHVHNQATLNSPLDDEVIADEMADLPDFDWEAFGFDAVIDEAVSGVGDADCRPSLADRFGVAPFTVLDARSGAWQERKRQWLALGIRSELGRGGGSSLRSGADGKAKAVPGGSPLPLNRRGGVASKADLQHRRQG